MDNRLHAMLSDDPRGELATAPDFVLAADELEERASEDRSSDTAEGCIIDRAAVSP
jgi:hypothetical protein